MGFSWLAPGRIPARGWSFPVIFTRAAVLPSSCWAQSSLWSLAGGTGLQARPPWRSLPLNPASSLPPSQTVCHNRAEETSCFPSLGPPLMFPRLQAAQGQPRLLGHWISHTQTGQSSNSQARQGEVERLRPHPPSAGEMKHESVSNVKGSYLPLKYPQGGL